MAKKSHHEHLRKVPLFASLDASELDAVGVTATELDVPAGRTLMTEGERAHEMYVLIDGTVEVTQEGEHIADVGPGGFVGEMALLSHSNRNSTVTTKTDVTVIHIDGREFTTLLHRVPSISAKMLPIVAGRVVENSDHHSD